MPYSPLAAVLLLSMGGFGATSALADSCRRCDSAGFVECPSHKRNSCPDDIALFCSERHGCGDCGGSGYIDCKRCERQGSEEELSRRVQKQAKLAEHWSSIEESMGFEVRRAQSEHFFLVWQVESLKVGRKKLDGHKLMHLYLNRLEAVYREYCSRFEVEDRSFRERFEVYVWASSEDQLSASTKVCGESSEYGVRLLGAKAHYSVCGGKRYFQSDRQLHQHLVHNVSHLILSHQRPTNWIGNIGHGWLDEGLAHWFEQEAFDRCDTYCFQEQNTSGAGFRGGDFRVRARKLVASGDAPPVAQVLTRNTDTLVGDEHVVSMSLVDFLIARDAVKFGELAGRLRARRSLRDALAELFGLKPLEWEREWKAWVLDTYSAR